MKLILGQRFKEIICYTGGGRAKYFLGSMTVPVVPKVIPFQC